MQIYIIGIGQCGTSIAFDVISSLTGFVKSKDVTSSPGQNRGDASNLLLERLNTNISAPQRGLERIRAWYRRRKNPDSPRKVFLTPRIAIVDGNPDNFVKDGFRRFQGGLVNQDLGLVNQDLEGKDSDTQRMLREVVALIQSTEVLDLEDWDGGCANGIVGEAIVSTNLPKARLRDRLHIDGMGNRVDDDGNAIQPVNDPSVSIYLVISSAGGGTGSGGGVYLSQSDALVDRAPNSPLVLNAVVLPSVGSSVNNPRYALNAGRALARYVNVIATKSTVDGERRRGSSAVLFSNPHDEGDRQALQTLNNYIADFSLRLANFTFAGNVAPIARDVDYRELASFLADRVSVLGMSHLPHSDWDEDNIEKQIVEKAFGDIYAKKGSDRPQGLSLEKTIRTGASGKQPHVLARTTSAIMVLGLPPDFRKSLDIEKMVEHVRKFSKSELSAGIRTYSYGSANDLEFTVLLRYRRLDACPLAQYFVGRYVDLGSGTGDAEMLETEYLKNRADRDDEYAELFEEIVRDLEELREVAEFDEFVLTSLERKTVRRRTDSNVGDGESS